LRAQARESHPPLARRKPLPQYPAPGGQSLRLLASPKVSLRQSAISQGLLFPVMASLWRLPPLSQ
jgi:hypothetical protein